MPKTRSAKGVMVDFDLLKIKRQMSEKPVSIDVKAREAFIDQKLRRRMRKLKQAAVAPIDVDSTLAESVPSIEQPMIQPQVVAVEIPAEQNAKQKLRPPSKS